MVARSVVARGADRGVSSALAGGAAGGLTDARRRDVDELTACVLSAEGEDLRRARPPGTGLTALDLQIRDRMTVDAVRHVMVSSSPASQTEVVAPSAVEVMLPVPGRVSAAPTKSLITLITCTPKYSARSRLVVRGAPTPWRSSLESSSLW